MSKSSILGFGVVVSLLSAGLALGALLIFAKPPASFTEASRNVTGRIIRNTDNVLSADAQSRVLGYNYSTPQTWVAPTLEHYLAPPVDDAMAASPDHARCIGEQCRYQLLIAPTE